MSVAQQGVRIRNAGGFPDWSKIGEMRKSQVVETRNKGPIKPARVRSGVHELLGGRVFVADTRMVASRCRAAVVPGQPA